MTEELYGGREVTHGSTVEAEGNRALFLVAVPSIVGIIAGHSFIWLHVVESSTGLSVMLAVSVILFFTLLLRQGPIRNKAADSAFASLHYRLAGDLVELYGVSSVPPERVDEAFVHFRLAEEEYPADPQRALNTLNYGLLIARRLLREDLRDRYGTWNKPRRPEDNNPGTDNSIG